MLSSHCFCSSIIQVSLLDISTIQNISSINELYVFSQAKEKGAQDQQNKMREEQDNFTEMANNVHGDMLTENPAVAQSAFGSHRVVPDRWKGMSPQQVQEVLETQEKQRQEKEVRVQYSRTSVQWTLTYPNTLGPSLVQICEKFGYEKAMQFLLDSV